LSSLFHGERQDDDSPEVDEKSQMMMQNGEIVGRYGEMMMKSMGRCWTWSSSGEI
jgi:hypothetical protein